MIWGLPSIKLAYCGNYQHSNFKTLISKIANLKGNLGSAHDGLKYVQGEYTSFLKKFPYIE